MAHKTQAMVPPALDGERLDKALAALVPELSRHLAKKVLAMGGVMVDGRRVRRASEPVRSGQQLQATWHPDILVPERFELEVLYEDEDVVVVVKPSGQLSQGSELGDVGSLTHALMRRYGREIRLMHRLDKGASGVMVAALNAFASAALTPQFREHTIERSYVAITDGVPAEGTCTTAIVQEGRLVRAARPGEQGLAARSEVRVIEVVERDGRRRARVEVTLHTGRTHQIRIHLQSLGAPIVGDPEHGGPAAPRLCLHATTLGFTHPRGHALRFFREAPAELTAALAAG